MTNYHFDLLQEINRDKTYNQLYPRREVGIVVFGLYEFTRNNTGDDIYFGEEDIKQVLYDCFPNGSSPHFNILRDELLEYFLAYDTTKKYYLKGYALKFCELGEKVLKDNFSPSEVELICKDLNTKLKLAYTDKGLEEWLVFFKQESPVLTEQIEALERQLKRAIVELRIKNTDRSDIIEKLRIIQENIIGISQNALKLRNAFGELNQMKYNLLDKRSEENEIQQRLDHAHSTLEQVQIRLQTTTNKLSKIQPRVNRLINNLSRSQYKEKVENFLNYLLSASEVVINDSTHHKELHLPTDVRQFKYPEMKIFHLRVSAHQNVFPTPPPKRKKVQVSDQQRNLALKKSRKRVAANIAVQQMTMLIKKDLETAETVSFSKYFFKILKENPDNPDCAILLTNEVIRKKKDYSWKTSVYDEHEHSEIHKNYTLRKMTISRL